VYAPHFTPAGILPVLVATDGDVVATGVTGGLTGVVVAVEVAVVGGVDVAGVVGCTTGVVVAGLVEGVVVATTGGAGVGAGFVLHSGTLRETSVEYTRLPSFCAIIRYWNFITP